MHNLAEPKSPESLRYDDDSSIDGESSYTNYLLANDGSASKADSKEENIIIENDHIMHYLKVQRVYRDTLFLSCASMLAGALLVTNGLKHHLLSFSMLCVAMITPVVSTITYKSKFGS